MENARSYGSRFSGLGLFLLALLVVGVLVFLTIRSARDNSQDNVVDSGEGTTQVDETSKPEFTIVAGQNSTEDKDGVVVTSDDNSNSTVAVTEPSTSETGTVAASTDDSDLPNTGPKDVMFAVLGLSLLSAALVGYTQSKQRLIEINKAVN
jgi:cytoskeletal protein RodZ